MGKDPSLPSAAIPAPEDGPTLDLAMELSGSTAFQRARACLESNDERTLADQAELTAIPAPPFGEGRRGVRFAELLRECADSVSTDALGNVLGWRKGTSDEAPLVVSAHLDTVFPAETTVAVTRDGDLLRGPGISDDGRGLAAVLALGRALDAGEIGLRRTLLLVGTVGEEGVGDLRGVRHLFGEGGGADGAGSFISLDGAGAHHIVTSAVGSRRYRLRVTGPGGHSWMDWGVPNPVHALCRVVASLTGTPPDPGATLSVGRIGGGISINAVPEEAWLDLDTRALAEGPLAGQEERVRGALEEAVTATDGARAEGTPALEWSLESLGHRPAGETPATSSLVRAAVAATRALYGDVELVASSTDANVPMSLGIPAVTMGAGGEAGQAHTADEWYRNSRGPLGIARALLTLLVLDRLEAG